MTAFRKPLVQDDILISLLVDEVGTVCNGGDLETAIMINARAFACQGTDDGKINSEQGESKTCGSSSSHGTPVV